MVQALSTHFDAAGFWRRSVGGQLSEFEQLERDMYVDAIVVGAGVTGLSSAIALAERGLKVVVLEAGPVGSGASTWNCGQLGMHLGLLTSVTLKIMGLKKASSYARILVEAIENVGHMIDRSGRDCDYLRNGNLTTGVHAAHEKTVRTEFEASKKVGLPVQWIEPEAFSQMGAPRYVHSAYHEMIGGSLNPAKFILALADIAKSLGVQIFQNSAVETIKFGEVVEAQTTMATVKARFGVLATNAYTSGLGLFRNSYIPVSVSAMVTKPLTPDQRKRLGWATSIGTHTAHVVIENIRLTRDNRILIGTKQVQIGMGDHIPNPENPKVFSALSQVLADRFPDMPDLEPDIGWTGRIALSSDTFPIFSHVKGHRNVVFGGAYGGHGVPMGSYAGNILADMLFDTVSEDAKVLTARKRLRLPPDPLRSFIGKGLNAGLKIGDNRIDAKVRKDLASVFYG